MSPETKAQKSWLEASAYYAGRATITVLKITGVKLETVKATLAWVAAISLLIILTTLGVIIDAYRSIFALAALAIFLVSIMRGYSWDDRKSRPQSFTPDEIKSLRDDQ